MKTRMISLAANLFLAASFNFAYADIDIWLGKSVINVNSTWYWGDNDHAWNNMQLDDFNGKDLGAITSLELGGHIETYDGQSSWNSGQVKMHYSISNSNISGVIDLIFKEFADNNNKFESGVRNNDVFSFKTIGIDISSLTPGVHELSIYFWLNDDVQDNNNGNNYKAFFTIQPPLVTLNDANDIPTSGQIYDVVLGNRTLSGGVWNTLCVPFNVTDFTGTPLEGASVKTLQSGTLDQNGVLTLDFGSNLTSIEAGKPYIVKPQNDVSYVRFNGVTMTNNGAQSVGGPDFCFTGCYNEEPIEGPDYLYIGAGNNIYYPEEGINFKIGAFRAYFEKLVQEGPAEVKAINLNFGDDTNSIQTISNETSSNEDYYTIDGRRLNEKPATAGLYIINGKKVVIK